MKRFATILFLVLMGLCSAARAQLSIEITGGGANQFPVAVLQFAGEDQLPASVTDIVEADLQRSGRFRLQYSGGAGAPPTEASQVNFAEWRNRSADALVIGAVQRLPDGRFEVRFRLLDVLRQTQLLGLGFTM